MNEPTLYEFFVQVKALAASKNWNIGRALFNHLWTVRPDIFNLIQGTRYDPYACDSQTQDQYLRAVALIKDHWDLKKPKD